MSAEKSLGTTLELVIEGQDNLLIANLTSIGEVGIESDEIDVTTLDSSGGYKEYIAGFKDGGEMSFAGIVKDEDALDSLLDLAGGQTVESWIMTIPCGSKWEFDGFIKSLKEAEKTVDGVREFNGSVRISGEPVYTPVSPSA